MTQPSRILWFAVFAAAQNYVTPTVKPTPSGQFIVVNNGPGDQTNSHVTADLVSYSNSNGTNATVSQFVSFFAIYGVRVHSNSDRAASDER